MRRGTSSDLSRVKAVDISISRSTGKVSSNLRHNIFEVLGVGNIAGDRSRLVDLKKLRVGKILKGTEERRILLGIARVLLVGNVIEDGARLLNQLMKLENTTSTLGPGAGESLG